MKAKMNMIQLSVAAFVTGVFTMQASEIKVGNAAELNSAIEKVKPGDHIIMANGNWKDTAITFTANGTAKDSIFLMAETPGAVALTGKSSLEISGNYLVVKGLWFKEGATDKKYVVSFSSNKKHANNSRLTNCAITHYNPDAKSATTHWVDLWGKNNRVDHCSIYGKNNDGTTLVVWLNDEQSVQNNHRIDHNYFGERPPLGANGGETMRIGTSTYSMTNSNTVVEFNTFEKCNGEVEVISNKSCGNLYRNNLFLESQGSLVMRHGNNCVAEGNVFLGNGKPYTGGIRIINEGHTVKNNYFGGLTGADFRGSLVMMNGVPNSPINRYNQVKDAKVLNNVFYNCGPFQLCAGADEERTLAPVNSVIEGNIVYSEKESLITAFAKTDGITFKNNVADAVNAKDTKGFTTKKLQWVNQNGLMLPKGQQPDYAVFAPAMTAKRGVSWTTKTAKAITATETITVQPGRGTLETAVKKAKGNAVFVLAAGKYELERSIIAKADIIIKAENATNKPVIAMASGLEKTPGYVFKIESGARLTVDNVIISGKDNTATKYAFSSPSEDTPGSYSLYIKNSEVSDFNNPEGGSVFRAAKGTMADTLSVSNSIFKNCFRGFNLSYEKDDKGKYNAENVIFENSVFTNFGQWVLHYYRGGNDESTVGGNLVVDHCVFSKIGSKDKDLVLLNKGIVNVKIQNSVFYDNALLINPVRLNGKDNSISNTLIYNSGEVKLTAKAVSSNLMDKNPNYTDTVKFVPKDKSPLKNAGTDGKDIGIIPGKI
nr:chondroitinase-B domain-containing protein [uncultured Flavobacterium sp.]